MERLKRRAVLLTLIEALEQKDSWCGETHIQKATYFLQDLLGVPLGFDFILYKHGPFSFDLSDELTAMRADEIIQLKLRPHPYGPSIIPGPNSNRLKELFPKTIERYKKYVDFLVNELGSYAVSELERLATARYVSRSSSIENISDKASHINNIKPHISVEDARRSLEDEQRIHEKAKEIIGTT
jgi:hypothetical protein